MDKKTKTTKHHKMVTCTCRLAVILFWVVAVVCPVYSEPKDSNTPPQAEKGAPAEATEEASPNADPKKEDKKEEKYVYSPAGKTDPFDSFLVKPGARARATSLSSRDAALDDAEAIVSEGEPRTELEKIEISKLTLTSIIKGEKTVLAMVIDPKGRGYYVKEGTKIGTQSGFVDAIVSEEKQTDFGIETVRKVVIKVPYRDRNKNIIYRSIEMEMP